MSVIPLDHTEDVSGQETHRLTTLFEAPEFVKSASNDQLVGDPTKLPRHVYADQYNRLYPCHTAAATWMSALFFNDKRADFSADTAAEINERIHRAAKYFGIDGLVTTVEKKAHQLRDEGLEDVEDDDWGIVWFDRAGNKERHWPMRNSTEVKFAAAHFNKYRDEFVFKDRHEIAQRVLKRAEQLNVDLAADLDALVYAAGRGACAAKTASELLRDRATLARRADGGSMAAVMDKVAAAVAQNPEHAREHETRLKLAAVIDEFDRATGLCRLYGDVGGLARPEEVLFAVTEKTAQDFLASNVETTTGNIYALDDLEKIALDDLRDWLGDDFADAVSAGGVFVDRDKLAAIVPTLDRGMAATFDRLVAEKAASAVVKTAEAADMLPLSRLHELAGN